MYTAAYFGTEIFSFMYGPNFPFFNLNPIGEFAEIFTTPLYFALISSVLLSGIALIRVNIVKRHSILWYTLSTMIGFFNRNQIGRAHV